MRTVAGARGEAGFSLIEAVVGATLMALLAMLLFSGLGLGSRVMDSGSRRAERSAQLSVAYNFLRNHLAQARGDGGAAREGGGAGHGAPVFDGRPDGAEFVGPAPTHLSLPGYQRVTLAVERGRTGARLVARWRPVQAAGFEAPAAVETRESVLLEDLAGAEFAYFGAAHPSSAPAWHDEWRAPARLPSLVRIRIAFGGGRPPQDLVVALRLATAPLARFVMSNKESRA